MTNTNKAKESGARGMRGLRVIRLGAAASGLAVVLACGVSGTASGAPSEPRQVHVEGQLIPVEEAREPIGSPAGWSAPTSYAVSE